MASFNFLIDLPVSNQWAKVDNLRHSILTCFSSVFGDMDGCHVLATVAGELLENAVKHGSWKSGQRPFRLRVCGFERKVEVIVENPVDPQSPSVAELFETLAWIRGCPTPDDAYRMRLEQIAERSGDDKSQSKLGLVRIAYESGCRLSAELDGDILRVSSEIAVS